MADDDGLGIVPDPDTFTDEEDDGDAAGGQDGAAGGGGEDDLQDYLWMQQQLDDSFGYQVRFYTGTTILSTLV
jgi:hypothetical protein